MIPILNQINAVQIVPPYSFKLNFNTVFSRMPLSPKLSFSSVFPTKMLSVLYFSSFPCVLHVRPSEATKKKYGTKTTETLKKSSRTSDTPMTADRVQHFGLLLTSLKPHDLADSMRTEQKRP